MPTVFEVGSYRIVVYPNDHGPAHVHAVGPDGVARFALGENREQVRIMDVDGIPKTALRRIAERIIDGRGACLATWRRVHGDQDPDR